MVSWCGNTLSLARVSAQHIPHTREDSDNESPIIVNLVTFLLILLPENGKMDKTWDGLKDQSQDLDLLGVFTRLVLRRFAHEGVTRSNHQLS